MLAFTWPLQLLSQWPKDESSRQQPLDPSEQDSSEQLNDDRIIHTTDDELFNRLKKQVVSFFGVQRKKGRNNMFKGDKG